MNREGNQQIRLVYEDIFELRDIMRADLDSLNFKIDNKIRLLREEIQLELQGREICRREHKDDM